MPLQPSAETDGTASQPKRQACELTRIIWFDELSPLDDLAGLPEPVDQGMISRLVILTSRELTVTTTAHYVKSALISGVTGSELLDYAGDIMRKRWRLRGLERDPGAVIARTKISFKSWSEDIRVEVTSEVPQSATVVISSRSVIKTTLIDWRVNRRNVEQLHTELIRRTTSPR